MTNASTGHAQAPGDVAATDTVTSAVNSTADLGLLVLRIGRRRGDDLQAGLIKAVDFGTTAGFMESGGWSLPTFAALMVTVAETAGGIGLILGVLTPAGGMRGRRRDDLRLGRQRLARAPSGPSRSTCRSCCSSVPRRCCSPGAGAYSVDARALGRLRWSPRIALGLLVLAFAVAILTWILLNGTNPIHFSSPA